MTAFNMLSVINYIVFANRLAIFMCYVLPLFCIIDVCYCRFCIIDNCSVYICYTGVSQKFNVIFGYMNVSQNVKSMLNKFFFNKLTKLQEDYRFKM